MIDRFGGAGECEGRARGGERARIGALQDRPRFRGNARGSREFDAQVSSKVRDFPTPVSGGRSGGSTLGEIMNGRTYGGQPANFLELTGPCREHVRFSSNGEIHVIERTEWDLLPVWHPSAHPDHPRSPET